MGYYLTSTEELQGIIRETVEELLNAKLPKQAEEKPKHPLDGYLNAKETADFLRLSITTIYSMTSRRQIPFYKRGKKLYFRRSDLEQWMDSSRRKDRLETKNEAVDYVQLHKRKA